ncbi:GNAT family N-acetyltransferase [Psychroflexus montanilacus]|uniref:GNAT family N-acetyltransferase n=1 Tax=Psychroflexus montanilacus TaxID=2873598 RepID=UPI001CCA0315|nr:GNAT family N-acetyltransferase [Psychroflexus montanilacus]MBZ9652577.1 GNAT family N-acetyltransferase [Psychroflexus montanilacus]
MIIKSYTSTKKKEWNTFIKQAKNATFLFEREFMDYHADRFTDYSLMVYDDKNKLVACLPANVTDENTVYSHQGLTYGGFCFKKELKLPVQLEIIQTILQYLNQQGVKKMLYKAFPRFYNELQTDEVEYAMFLLNANLYRRDTALAIDYSNRFKYSSNYRREAKQAAKIGIKVMESDEFESFWRDVLEPNLYSRFKIKPVHNIEEILLLKSKFPNNIKLYIAQEGNKTIAGTVFFETKTVAHAQYISATDEARKNGALNQLYLHLIDKVFNDKKYFDFGIANENNGKVLNQGLLAWKERMGGRAYSHDFYEIKTSNYLNLQLDE